MKTAVDNSKTFGSHYSVKCSTWKSLKRAVRTLKELARSRSLSSKHTHVSDMESEIFIIKTLQEEVYAKEILLLRSGLPLPKQSNLLTLSPYLDDFAAHRRSNKERQLEHRADESSVNSQTSRVYSHYTALS